MSDAQSGGKSIDDELAYWRGLGNRNAEVFVKYLTPLTKTLHLTEQANLRNIREILEDVDLQLSELWKQKQAQPPYPEERMRKIFQFYEDALIIMLKQSQPNVDFWMGEFRKSEELIPECLAVCDRWLDICRILVDLWKECSNPWKSDTIESKKILKIRSRFNQLSIFRSVIENTENLLGVLSAPSPLQVFLNIDCTDVSSDGDNKWKTAVGKFDERMERHENAVVEILKTKFQDTTSTPLQMMMEFGKCKGVIRRGRVKSALNEEREALLGHLETVIRKYEEKFKNEDVEIFNDQSLTISTMIWLRQLAGGVEELYDGLEDALEDLAKFPPYKSRIETLQQGIRSRLQEKFDVWCKELLQGIANPRNDVNLDISGRLMEIEQPSGRLKVNFSDRLVLLIKEVRWLESVGYRVPEAIIDRCNIAKKFYDSGIVLMQVAHFYNTIDQQMINCQKPMMLESARRFERTIRSEKINVGKGTSGMADIKWSDLKRVETYVDEIHAATLALTKENRRLRSMHQKVVSLVLQMCETNIMQNTTTWKRLLNEIHKIVASVAVESQRYPPENMMPWRLHIDHQVKKAIEVQLRRSLLALVEDPVEVHIEMIYRNQRLQYRPSIPELRVQFWEQIQTLFDLPSTFKHLSEINEKRGLFREATANCQSEVILFHKRNEELLKKMEGLLEESAQYVILGSVNIYALVESRVKKLEDWEHEMRALKQRGRLMDQMPSQITIDNMVISLTSLRTTVDGFLHDVYEALINTLRKSVSADIQTVSGFVAEATTILTGQPSTPEELATLAGEYYRVLQESNQNRPMLTELEEKNKFLKSVSGKGVDRSDDILRSWDSLSSLLVDHRSVVEKQTSALQGKVGKDLQLLSDDLEKFSARWERARPSADLLKTLDVLQLGQVAETVKGKREELAILADRYEKLSNQSQQLGLQKPDRHVIDNVIQELDSAESMWKEVLEFAGETDQFAKEEWMVFRNKLYRFQDFLEAWSNRMNTTKKPTSFTLHIQNQVTQYRMALPALKSCRGESFSDEHWGELIGILKLSESNPDQLTFGHFLAVINEINKHSSPIKDLASRAQAEVSIREALRELEIWGATIAFHLISYQDSSGTTLQMIKDWSELFTIVGEKQRLLHSTKESHYYVKFADRISIWDQRLLDLSFYLDNLHQIQRRWIYLEPICARNTLPNEEGRFKRADSDFRVVLAEIAKDPRLISWMKPSLKNTLPTILDQLQRSQKALNDFLESKRLAFPRFYFIGDDDLLEILGQSANPKVLQSHLRKLFAGVQSVEFDDDRKRIMKVRSAEGETLTLKTPIVLNGAVEIWLSTMSLELKNTLKSLTKQCYSDKTNASTILSYPAQVLRLVEKIQFSKSVEVALPSGNLGPVRTALQERLNFLTSKQHETTEVVQLATIKGLILDTIHRLSIVDELISAKISAVDDWLWQKQLRFYLEADSTVTVKMVDAEFKYSFEYQGCQPGLVHTPLTDKCYLTLTQAMNMGLGGNPYGPAGTGKTESVKELGAHLGRQVLVFNCDEGIDPKSMGRIFIGILKCGAWGCFDEFNRLDELTLSAISMQILSIQAALKNSTQQLELLDRKIDINREAGIFITLNPATKGYGGRQKLPDNLKQLFRPIAMTAPDNELIAEVILLSEGFQHARSLGKKVVIVYRSSKELLSGQQHYDWGLRAIKTTIQMAGRLIAMRKSTSNGRSAISEKEEGAMLVQALKSNTSSKLALVDQNRFLELIRDAFPDVDLQDVENLELRHSISSVFEDFRLTVNEVQVRKAMELKDQLSQRMGVVIVGPAGSGKTTVINLLSTALNKLNQSVKQYRVNPTSMPKTELLGFVEENTREWTDGVLTNCVRDALKETTSGAAWIVCDGDIDPDWIESLNSVLDDNHLLTLPSGERLRLSSNINFLFETSDLSAASPATVSRMGMVFLSSKDVPLTSVVESWIKKRPQSLQDSTAKYIDQKVLLQAVSKLADQENFYIKLSQSAIASNALSRMGDVMSHQDFAVRLVQSLGGLLQGKQQSAFIQEVLKLTGNSAPDPTNALNIIYDSNLSKIKVVQVLDVDSQQPKFLNTQNPFVPCLSHELTLLRIIPWIEQRESLLLVGPDGCGKKTVLLTALSRLAMANIVIIQCTSLTNARTIIGKLKQNCVSMPSPTGRVMRPKHSDRLVILLTDIHVVGRDRWGHCQTEAFLRQVLSQNGYHDTNSDWVHLENVQFLVTASLRSPVDALALSDRLLSLLRVTFLEFPSSDDLFTVCLGHLKMLFSGRTHPLWSQKKNVERLANLCVILFLQVREKFTRNMSAHYVFTLGDLTEWISGLCRYNIDDQSGAALLSAVYFEAARIFRDKLSSTLDETYFDAVISSAFRKEWSTVSFDLDNMYCAATLQNSTGLIEGAPLPGSGRPLVKTNSEELRLLLKNAVRRINRENVSLEAILHDELISNVLKLDHWMGIPGGAAAVVAPGGYGRRTVAIIASKLQQAIIMKPKIVKGYNVKSFRNDLKKVLDVAGVKSENVVFLLEDYQVLDVVFLEMITCILVNGEYPGLFSDEESEKIHAILANQSQTDLPDSTPAALFLARIKRNFHCLVTLDTSGDRCASICSRIPAFMKHCHLVWVPEISQITFASLPKIVPIAGSPTEESPPAIITSNSLISNFTFIHQNSPKALQNPARFLHLLSTCNSIKTIVTNMNQKRSDRLQAGLDQLTKARGDVMSLKQLAGQQQKALLNKQEEAKRAMDEIRESMAGAHTQKEEVTLLKADLETEKIKLQEREQTIAKELAEVLPLLESAKQAVNKIKTSDLNEIKSLRAPPTVVNNILEGVLKLFGNKDTSWSGMRTFLSPSVKDEIIHFDADKIPKENLRLTQQVLEKYRSSFDDETAKRASAAVAPLAAWVKACVKYAEVYDKIAPLANEKRKLEQNIQLHGKRVTGADQDLGKLSTRIDLLQQNFEVLTEEAAVMKIELAKVTGKLQTASFLVEKLESEFNRWSTQLRATSENLKTLEMNTLLSSGFVTYLGACTEDERLEYVTKWTQHFGTGQFDILEQLTTETSRMERRIEGLPSDTLSMGNAVIIATSDMQPLIIDPSGAVLIWLRNFLKAKTVEVVDQANTGFQSNLELAIRFGKSLIVEISEHVDPVLVPVLRGDLVKQGSRVQVEMGEKLVDYHPDFHLYLITRNHAIQLHPQIAALVNRISFTATRAGLTSQLLSLVIEVKLPEVEVRRKQLLQEQETLKIRLTELEDNLLNLLAGSQENILENTELRESLSKAKNSADTVEQNLLETKKVQETLEKDQAVFAILATKCASICFALQGLSKLNSLYRFSQQTFMGIYRKAVAQLAKDDTVKDQLQKFCALAFYQVIHYVYYHISRGIFKSDRLTVLLYLIKHVRPELMRDSEWQLFLTKASSVLEKNSPGPPSFLSPSQQGAMADFSRALPDVFSALQLEDQSLWRPFLAHAHCETVFPANLKLTPFQQVLILSLLRPDRLISALSVFAAKSLKLPDLATDASLKSVLTESSASVPILVITSAGFDPTLELTDLARESGMDQKFVQIAMGSHETEQAITGLKQISQSGGWLCLKNLHLVPLFLQNIAKDIKELKPVQAFRLWLITEATVALPSVLLETCIKCVYEAPPGVKQNLQRTLKRFPDQPKSPGNLILYWFHALVQERRNYIPRGWTRYYEFNNGDLQAAIQILKKHSSSSTVSGLLENVFYGGRVVSAADFILLCAYVKGYFQPDALKKGIFKENLAGKFQPTVSDAGKFQQFVQSLPEIDEPELLGLPANIDGAHQKAESVRMLRDLRWIENSEAVGLQARNSQVDAGFDTIRRIVTSAKTKFAQFGRDSATAKISPLESFLQGEITFGRDLLHQIEEDIGSIASIKADAERAIVRSLAIDETPESWLDVCHGPSHPVTYVETIYQMTTAAAEMISRVKSKTQSLNFDVTEMFHPEKLPIALLHLAARESRLPLEELAFFNEWSLNVLQPVTYAVRLSGMQLEGASFSNGVLKECSYDSPTSSAAPDCYVAWAAEKSSQVTKNSVRLTVFDTSQRENVAFYLSVPCEGSETRWNVSGAAFILKS